MPKFIPQRIRSKELKECINCHREGHWLGDKCSSCIRKTGGVWCIMCEEGFIPEDEICSYCSFNPKKQYGKTN